jgi:hypothetical protein
MATEVALPIGSYLDNDPRGSNRRLLNCFSEVTAQSTPADSKSKTIPILLRRWAGITALANDGTTNTVRGFWELQGLEYVVIGPTLYRMASNGNLTQIGTGIAGGSGFVRMSDNGECLFILIPGTALAWTYCPDSPSGFSQFLNATFLQYGAIDVKFVDSFFVFLAISGKLFYNDDGRAVSGNGPPTFTTGGVFPRNFGTDLFIGMGVDHRNPLMFGSRTTEGYINAGNPVGTPFSAAPDMFMEIGCHPQCGYTIANQDQSIFWVANDKTVRRRNGQTPVRISNSGIEDILQKANFTGAYALTPSIAGHPLWVLVLPNAPRTLVYDCLTSEWFDLASFGLGYWRIQAWHNAFNSSMQLVGDTQGKQVGFLDTTVFNEFGTVMSVMWDCQAVYDGNNRISHKRLDVVVTSGEPDPTSVITGFDRRLLETGPNNFRLLESGTGPSSPNGAARLLETGGQQSTLAPGTKSNLTLYVSDDSGRTFRALPMRSLGELGNYTARAVWFNIGMSRSRVNRLLISDPTPTFTVQMTTELQGGRW